MCLKSSPHDPRLVQFNQTCLNRDTEGIIKRISSSLPRQSIGRNLCIITRSSGVLAGLATVREALADKSADNVDIVGRAMVEILLVDGGEGIRSAAVTLSGELNRRVCAVAEVSGAGSELAGGSGVAGIL